MDSYDMCFIRSMLTQWRRRYELLPDEIRAHAVLGQVTVDLWREVGEGSLSQSSTIGVSRWPPCDRGGGTQINFPGFLCSLGFNASRSGTRGFVTASHCTSIQGGVEGTPYWQPLESVRPIQIATETVDPAYPTGGSCPAGRNCMRGLGHGLRGGHTHGAGAACATRHCQ